MNKETIRNVGSWNLVNVDLMDRAFEIVAISQGDKVTLMRGSLKDVAMFMDEIGFSMNEVELAVENMEDQGHDVAHFGVVNKSFMYTTLTEEMSRRIA